MSERNINFHEFEPCYTALEENGDILTSPFLVAVFGHAEQEWLGVGEVVGIRKQKPTSDRTARNPIIRLKDPSSPSGVVELVGGIDCLWTPEVKIISTMTQIARECPQSIIPAYDYVRQLRAPLN